jgi:hypothetical protein
MDVAGSIGTKGVRLQVKHAVLDLGQQITLGTAQPAGECSYWNSHPLGLVKRIMQPARILCSGRKIEFLDLCPEVRTYSTQQARL